MLKLNVKVAEEVVRSVRSPYAEHSPTVVDSIPEDQSIWAYVNNDRSRTWDKTSRDHRERAVLVYVQTQPTETPGTILTGRCSSG